MFRSPFDDLGVAQPEEVEGDMQCFTCYDMVNAGEYDPIKHTLSYTCRNAHITVLENYHLE